MPSANLIVAMTTPAHHLALTSMAWHCHRGLTMVSSADPYTSVTPDPATTLMTMATARTHAHTDPKPNLGHAGAHAPSSVTASQARTLSVPSGSSVKHRWARSRAAHLSHPRTFQAS